MKHQQGFALVSAIFLIVIVAAMAAFATRIGIAQQNTVDLRMLGDRAEAAANAGIEWSAYRILQLSAPCAATPPFTVNGFTVTVTCVQTPHTAGFNTYEVTSQAHSQNATYGSPDYVYRKVTKRFVR